MHRIHRTRNTFDLPTGTETPDIRAAKYIGDTDNLSCPICKQPYVVPMTTFCGHTFCRSCIQQCLTRGADHTEGFCPLDRTPLNAANVHDLFPTPFVITNMVDDLKVYCFNSARGCAWTGHRWEVCAHVTADCGYTGVPCNLPGGKDEDESVLNDDNCTGLDTETEEPDAGAGEGDPEDRTTSEEASGEGDSETIQAETIQTETIQRNTEDPEDPENPEDPEDPEKEVICTQLTERRFLVDAKQCVHQPYPCRFCQQPICKVTEETHLSSECALNYVTCSLCANDTIPQKALARHESNCLRAGKYPCPAHDIGCRWVGTNEPAYEVHAKAGHCALNSLHPYIKRLEADMAALAADNKLLQKQIHQILGNIVQGKIANLGYSEPVEEIGAARDHLKGQIKHLAYEMDLYKSELDERITPYIERESRKSSEKESVLNGLVNDNFMMRDELNLQRKVVANLRKQVQYLTFTNRGGPFMPSAPPPDLDASDVVTRSSSEERLNLKL